MKKPCKYPGCRELLCGGGYCDKHAKSQPKPNRGDYDKTRRANVPELAEAARIRSGARWKRAARVAMSSNPLCSDPYHIHGGQTVPANDVHHIQGLAKRPDLAYHADNLMPLCRRCHARIERDERKSLL